MGICRMSIIGTGGMGRKYAEMILSGKIRNMVLTAMVCRSEGAKKWGAEAAEQRASGMPEPKMFDSSDEMFAEADLFDAVLIVTPHKSHPELAMQAFALKKHVFCDKPAGITAGEAEDMAECAEKNNVLYAMMFHQRREPRYMAVSEILKEGRLGRLHRVLLESTRYFRTEYYHASGAWRSSWNGEGGGMLINQGQHILDHWQNFFGLPESLYAEIPFGKYNNFTVDDEAVIVMKYSDGMTGTFIGSTGEAEWTERLSVEGSKGKLVLRDHVLELSEYGEDSDSYRKNALVTDGRDLKITRTVKEYVPASSFRLYQEMLDNFAAAVNGEEELIVPGSEGIASLAITNAAYLSAWKHMPVSVPVDQEEYAEYLRKASEKEKQS